MEAKIKKLSRRKSKKIETDHKTKSKSKQNFDFYSISKQNSEKWFDDIEKTIPRYNQIITELLQEFILYYKDALKISNSFQKNFFVGSKIETGDNGVISKTVTDVSKNLIVMQQVRNEFFLSSLDSIKNIFREWNKEKVSYSNSFIKIFSAKY